MEKTSENKEKPTVSIHVRVTPSLAAELRKLADRERRSLANQASFIIEQNVNQAAA